MSINWFEIVSYVINFFVLLFILQKIFYKPVIKVMEERQARIDESLSSALEKEEEAKELTKTYKEKLKEVEKTKETILKEAKKEAKEQKEQWLEQYQEEATAKRQHYFSELVEEKETFSQALQDQMVLGAVDLASGLIQDTKTKDWEEKLFESLILKLKEYEFPTSKKDSGPDSQKLVLVSAHDLGEEKKKTLAQTLEEKKFRQESLQFQEDDSLLLGYELQMPSHTIYASAKNYLENSKEKLSSLLDRTVYDEES